jgi:SNF2 family DNA or RNA helicase
VTIIASRFGDSQIEITTNSDLRDRDLIKQIDGARYNLKMYKWLAPLTWACCRSLRGIFGDALEIAPDLAEWAWKLRAEVIDPALKLRNAWEAEGDKDLYPYQRAGVQFLATVRKALLLDEMGTGKTVQTIRTLAEIQRRGDNPFPALVIAPNNMVLTWVKEFARWWPGVKVVAVRGSAVKRREILEDKSVHVFVLNYENARMHSRLAESKVRLRRCVVCDPTVPKTPQYSQARCEWCKKELNKRPWTTIIVDEGHRMKNVAAKQTRAIWALRTVETKNVFVLTGTAIAAIPTDLWPALHLLSKDEFAVRSKYVDRYCQTMFEPWGAGLRIIGLRQDTKDEFFDIIDPRMRRMPKAAVLPFLPEKVYSRRYLDMHPKQATAYKQMKTGMISIIGADDNSVTVASNPLVQLTRLTQFSSAYAETNADGDVRLTSPSNKVDGLMQELEDMGDEALVVFANSRQLIELAAEAVKKDGISYGMIVGGQSMDEREDAKEAFQAGKIRVILCTISAGGIGITLTRAKRVLFMQRSWSMIENKQAEDRVHRIGSEIHDTIEVVDLISNGTMEQRMLDVVLPGKADRLEEIMRDAATVRRMVMDVD